jgi:hypothetical protein
LGYTFGRMYSPDSKIRHYLEKIREIVDRLEVPLPKKEALTAKITALTDEVDRDRTRLDAYAGLALEMAATGGEVGAPAQSRAEVPGQHRRSPGVRKAGRRRAAEPARIPRTQTPHTTSEGTPARAGAANPTYWTTIFPFERAKAVAGRLPPQLAEGEATRTPVSRSTDFSRTHLT